MKTAQIPETFFPDPDSLKDKVILVTGATGGYGKAFSKIYAEAGATVILLGKNVRLLENLYDEIENAGCPTPAIYPLNLEGAVEKDYYDMAQNIDKEFGKLDGLVHTAGVLGTRTPFEHSETENWYKVMQINLNGPYMMTKHCIPLLKKSDHASLLFMTDDKIGAYWDAYPVSKQAVNGLMLNLAAEFEGSNLYTNAFNPGPSKTRLQIQAYPAATDNDTLPDPFDHKVAILYLMDKLQMINGHVFVI